ncbi:glycosyltransferase family 4 protein [Curtobacterium sp. TXMA1]|uniref:glycosyltransferase family 4 protein n=1 Tax=Curtobacterium sp. TXMA1 TaxID=2876939 RepID=UPI001CC966E1|nr:glycosyltransferase family 4 protein [Curtobacterium sp. TXMA1]UBQ03084.1 glycosyltransferase family 4 protein [Curtobacterium sp. TXMA1]
MNIFVASRAAEGSLVERYGIALDKIVYVGNGLNQLSAESAVVRSGRPRRVLFVGREPLRKGLDILLSAMSEVVKIIPDATLTVVGTGEFALGSEPEWLDSRGLVRDRLELSAIYDDHDIFCLPARQESFGLVAVEALSRGLPCVVSSVGELPNTVRDRLEGRVVAAEDVDALATALIELMADDREFSLMSARALARASAFDWDEIAGRILRRITNA